MDSSLVASEINPETRRCPRCTEVKALDGFSKCARNVTGVQAWCKICHSNWSKEHPHLVTVSNKVCKHCGYLKPASAFSIDSAKKDGLRNICKAHDSKLRKQRWDPVVEARKALCHREGNRAKAMLKAIRQGAKKRGIACTLVEADLASVPVPATCPVLGIPLFWTRGMRTENTPSIDRLNPNGIYEMGNWRYISWEANRLRSNCSDPKIFAAIAADNRRLAFSIVQPIIGEPTNLI